MKKLSKVIIILSAVVLFVIGSYNIYTIVNNKTNIKATNSDYIVNVIITGPENAQIYNDQVNINSASQYGTTALQTLDSSKVPYEIKGTDNMIYVYSINGIDSTGSSGWMYKVNDIPPNVGASEYKLNNGDTVTWYFSSF